MQEFKFWAKLGKWPRLLFLFIGLCLAVFFLVTTGYLLWEKNYKERVYPGLKIEGQDLGGKTPQEVKDYFQQKNDQIDFNFTLIYKDKVATLSAQEFNWGYDVKLISSQVLAFGRSGYFLSDLYHKMIALREGQSLEPAYAYEESKLVSFATNFAEKEKINFPPQEALFQFKDGRVTAFRPSAEGQTVDLEKLKIIFTSELSLLKGGQGPSSLTVELPVKKVEPKVTTERVNNLGIRELVGRGTSRFLGSISNRIYNIQLASSRLNGILVAPGEEFSFNRALGDVSKFTGYREAYIIKEGRTILGDGGGVCQVSTTFFRALLNAGLPISERHAHSYRVGYYEKNSPPGFDASVYDPQWDLKFKNDTGNYLLIQTPVNLSTATLTFELYGTSDGRSVAISKPIIKNEVPPPEDLYQDDPNLPKGEVKQIDWKAWGADVSFSRKVTRGGEVLISETFSSYYQPWQAVFLRGTKE